MTDSERGPDKGPDKDLEEKERIAALEVERIAALEEERISALVCLFCSENAPLLRLRSEFSANRFMADNSMYLCSSSYSIRVMRVIWVLKACAPDLRRSATVSFYVPGLNTVF